MSIKFDDQLVNALKKLSVDRDKWHRFAIAQATVTPKSALLRDLTEKSESWDLTLAAYGFASGISPKNSSVEEIESKLRMVVHEISESGNIQNMPGFSEVLRVVCTAKDEDLIRDAPRTERIIENSSATTMSIFYCLDMFPDCGPEFDDCMRKFGRSR